MIQFLPTAGAKNARDSLPSVRRMMWDDLLWHLILCVEILMQDSELFIDWRIFSNWLILFLASQALSGLSSFGNMGIFLKTIQTPCYVCSCVVVRLVFSGFLPSNEQMYDVEKMMLSLSAISCFHYSGGSCGFW